MPPFFLSKGGKNAFFILKIRKNKKWQKFPWHDCNIVA